ncbi:hypothetical protein HXX76_002798 [Chlamydomonas incerta]|uniref:Protein kinase domain-containing protein n=1 Tax=Chlamydomonas incerta TaxID=51695 RepID=A0A835TR66_CHLIN|nr:hypothetical protein HXX76_002798 [Chlamydomonas incerta]|eukprot:KAG2442715.1 hypothetical protein HXX76_002798 [Chlamydomonas incerta]
MAMGGTASSGGGTAMTGVGSASVSGGAGCSSGGSGCSTPTHAGASAAAMAAASSGATGGGGNTGPYGSSRMSIAGPPFRNAASAVNSPFMSTSAVASNAAGAAAVGAASHAGVLSAARSRLSRAHSLAIAVAAAAAAASGGGVTPPAAAMTATTSSSQQPDMLDSWRLGGSTAPIAVESQFINPNSSTGGGSSAAALPPRASHSAVCAAAGSGLLGGGAGGSVGAVGRLAHRASHGVMGGGKFFGPSAAGGGGCGAAGLSRATSAASLNLAAGMMLTALSSLPVPIISSTGAAAAPPAAAAAGAGCSISSAQLQQQQLQLQGMGVPAALMQTVWDGDELSTVGSLASSVMCPLPLLTGARTSLIEDGGLGFAELMKGAGWRGGGSGGGGLLSGGAGGMAPGAVSAGAAEAAALGGAPPLLLGVWPPGLLGLTAYDMGMSEPAGGGGAAGQWRISFGTGLPMSLLAGGGADITPGAVPLTPGGGGSVPSASWLADGPYSGVSPGLNGSGLIGTADMLTPEAAAPSPLAAVGGVGGAGTAGAVPGSRLRVSHNHLSSTDYTAAVALDSGGGAGAGPGAASGAVVPAAAEGATPAAPAPASSAAGGLLSAPSRLRACLTNWGRKRMGSLGRRIPSVSPALWNVPEEDGRCSSASAATAPRGASALEALPQHAMPAAAAAAAAAAIIGAAGAAGACSAATSCARVTPGAAAGFSGEGAHAAGAMQSTGVAPCELLGLAGDMPSSRTAALGVEDGYNVERVDCAGTGVVGGGSSLDDGGEEVAAATCRLAAVSTVATAASGLSSGLGGWVRSHTEEERAQEDARMLLPPRHHGAGAASKLQLGGELPHQGAPPQRQEAAAALNLEDARRRLRPLSIPLTSFGHQQQAAGLLLPSSRRGGSMDGVMAPAASGAAAEAAGPAATGAAYLSGLALAPHSPLASPNTYAHKHHSGTTFSAAATAAAAAALASYNSGRWLPAGGPLPPPSNVSTPATAAAAAAAAGTPDMRMYVGGYASSPSPWTSLPASCLASPLHSRLELMADLAPGIAAVAAARGSGAGSGTYGALLREYDGGGALSRQPSMSLQVCCPTEVALHKLIGRGCAGRVYRGLWRGETVAIKVITCTSAAAAPPGGTAVSVSGAGGEAGAFADCFGLRDDEVKKIEQEAALGMVLVHPNIVATFAAFTTVSAPAPAPPSQHMHSASLANLMPYSAGGGGGGGGTAVAPSSGTYWMGGAAGSVASCSSTYTTFEHVAQGQRPSQVMPGRTSGSGGAAGAAAAAGLLQRGKTSQKWRAPHESSLTAIGGSPAAGDGGGGSGSLMRVISPGAIAAAAPAGLGVGAPGTSAAAAPHAGHGGGAPSSPRSTTRMGALGSLGRFPLSRQPSTLSRVSRGVWGQLQPLPPSLVAAGGNTAAAHSAADPHSNGTAGDASTSAAVYPLYRRGSNTISGCVPSSYTPTGSAAVTGAGQLSQQPQQGLDGSRSQPLTQLDASTVAATGPAAAGPAAAVSTSGQLGACSPVHARSGAASGLLRHGSTTISNSSFAPVCTGVANAAGTLAAAVAAAAGSQQGLLPLNITSPSPRPQALMRCGSMGDMSFARVSGGYGGSGHPSVAAAVAAAGAAAASAAAASAAGYGIAAAACCSPVFLGSPGMQLPPPPAPPPRATRWETFIVMELCPCGSLRSVLDAKLLHDKRGAPKLHEVLPLAWEVACALQYLHANGVLHCDLKAANVMLMEAPPPPPAACGDGRSSAVGSAAASAISTAASGGVPATAAAVEGIPPTPAAAATAVASIVQQLLGSAAASANATPRSSSRQAPTGNAWPTYTAKVADFSHSLQVELVLRRLQQQAGGAGGAAGGGMEGEMASPSHAAPELFEEGARPTFASDTYSLGVVLWELYGGRKPYDKYTVGDVLAAKRSGAPTEHHLLIPPAWPPTLAALIRRCWAAEPAQRPPMGEVVGALTQLCQSTLPHVELSCPVMLGAEGQEEKAAGVEEGQEEGQEEDGGYAGAEEAGGSGSSVMGVSPSFRVALAANGGVATSVSAAARAAAAGGWSAASPGAVDERCLRVLHDARAVAAGALEVLPADFDTEPHPRSAPLRQPPQGALAAAGLPAFARSAGPPAGTAGGAGDAYTRVRPPPLDTLQVAALPPGVVAEAEAAAAAYLQSVVAGPFTACAVNEAAAAATRVVGSSALSPVEAQPQVLPSSSPPLRAAAAKGLLCSHEDQQLCEIAVLAASPDNKPRPQMRAAARSNVSRQGSDRTATAPTTSAVSGGATRANAATTAPAAWVEDDATPPGHAFGCSSQPVLAPSQALRPDAAAGGADAVEGPMPSSAAEARAGRRSLSVGGGRQQNTPIQIDGGDGSGPPLQTTSESLHVPLHSGRRPSSVPYASRAWGLQQHLSSRRHPHQMAMGQQQRSLALRASAPVLNVSLLGHTNVTPVDPETEAGAGTRGSAGASASASGPAQGPQQAQLTAAAAAGEGGSPALTTRSSRRQASHCGNCSTYSWGAATASVGGVSSGEGGGRGAGGSSTAPSGGARHALQQHQHQQHHSHQQQHQQCMGASSTLLLTTSNTSASGGDSRLGGGPSAGNSLRSLTQGMRSCSSSGLKLAADAPVGNGGDLSLEVCLVQQDAPTAGRDSDNGGQTSPPVGQRDEQHVSRALPARAPRYDGDTDADAGAVARAPANGFGSMQRGRMLSDAAAADAAAAVSLLACAEISPAVAALDGAPVSPAAVAASAGGAGPDDLQAAADAAAHDVPRGSHVVTPPGAAGPVAGRGFARRTASIHDVPMLGISSRLAPLPELESCHSIHAYLQAMEHLNGLGSGGPGGGGSSSSGGLGGGAGSSSLAHAAAAAEQEASAARAAAVGRRTHGTQPQLLDDLELTETLAAAGSGLRADRVEWMPFMDEDWPPQPPQPPQPQPLPVGDALLRHGGVTTAPSAAAGGSRQQRPQSLMSPGGPLDEMLPPAVPCWTAGGAGRGGLAVPAPPHQLHVRGSSRRSDGEGGGGWGGGGMDAAPASGGGASSASASAGAAGAGRPGALWSPVPGAPGMGGSAVRALHPPVSAAAGGPISVSAQQLAAAAAAGNATIVSTGASGPLRHLFGFEVMSPSSMSRGHTGGAAGGSSGPLSSSAWCLGASPPTPGEGGLGCCTQPTPAAVVTAAAEQLHGQHHQHQHQHQLPFGAGGCITASAPAPSAAAAHKLACGAAAAAAAATGTAAAAVGTTAGIQRTASGGSSSYTHLPLPAMPPAVGTQSLPYRPLYQQHYAFPTAPAPPHYQQSHQPHPQQPQWQLLPRTGSCGGSGVSPYTCGGMAGGGGGGGGGGLRARGNPARAHSISPHQSPNLLWQQQQHQHQQPGTPTANAASNTSTRTDLGSTAGTMIAGPLGLSPVSATDIAAAAAAATSDGLMTTTAEAMSGGLSPAAPGSLRREAGPAVAALPRRALSTSAQPSPVRFQLHGTSRQALQLASPRHRLAPPSAASGGTAAAAGALTAGGYAAASADALLLPLGVGELRGVPPAATAATAFGSYCGSRHGLLPGSSGGPGYLDGGSAAGSGAHSSSLRVAASDLAGASAAVGVSVGGGLMSDQYSGPQPGTVGRLRANHSTPHHFHEHGCCGQQYDVRPPSQVLVGDGSAALAAVCGLLARGSGGGPGPGPAAAGAGVGAGHRVALSSTHTAHTAYPPHGAPAGGSWQQYGDVGSEAGSLSMAHSGSMYGSYGGGYSGYGTLVSQQHLLLHTPSPLPHSQHSYSQLYGAGGTTPLTYSAGGRARHHGGGGGPPAAGSGSSVAGGGGGAIGVSSRRRNRQHSRMFTTEELEAALSSIPRFGDSATSYYLYSNMAAAAAAQQHQYQQSAAAAAVAGAAAATAAQQLCQQQEQQQQVISPRPQSAAGLDHGHSHGDRGHHV